MTAGASLAVLTPEGRGAIAVIRVWGEGALRVVDSAFRPVRGGRLAESRAGRLRLGRLGAGLGDEVVAVVFAGDPPEIEVHCHGGAAARELVVSALVEAGAVVVPPSEWVHQACNSRTTAEATLDLAEAPTLRTAEILLEQSLGALDLEIRRLLPLIRGDSSAAIAGLDALIRRSAIGLRLVEGWRVVLAGRPNVGKSALLNVLAGYERAIVDPTPGTTRDIVTARLALNGWPVELADTAGLRPALDPIESVGVALARARQAEADLVLLVLDGSLPISGDDVELMAGHPHALRVASKADLSPAWEASEHAAMRVSATRGDGIEDLARTIAARLISEVPPPGAGVPFRARHIRRLDRARRLAKGGRANAAARALERLPGS